MRRQRVRPGRRHDRAIGGIAYQSNDSGRNQIFVRPFPNVEAGGRWQVSTELDGSAEASGAGEVAGSRAARILSMLAACARHRRLVVMGTHGRSGIDGLLLGSMTAKVVWAAPCLHRCAFLGTPSERQGHVAARDSILR